MLLESLNIPLIGTGISFFASPVWTFKFVLMQQSLPGKVGICSYLSRLSAFLFSVSLSPEPLIINPIIESVQTAVNDLTSNGINKIIALGHSDLQDSMNIARNVAGVDIVVTGSNVPTLLWNGMFRINSIIFLFFSCFYFCFFVTTITSRQWRSQGLPGWEGPSYATLRYIINYLLSLMAKQKILKSDLILHTHYFVSH